jgi:hypothetical protein
MKRSVLVCFILICIILGILLLFSCCYAADNPVEWEHGWKTDDVIATRYQNKQVGYNIGFQFPRNPNNCDRSEIFDFITKQQGNIYQVGGYPGAEMFVIFKDVTDKTTANKKLKSILPALSRLIRSL